jgi:hypothetical protein
MSGLSKKASAESKALLETKSLAFHLELPTLQNCEKKLLLFINYPVED